MTEDNPQATRPSPGTLWNRAAAENPTDADGRTRRYLELMRTYGHIIDREPGDTSPLFACGYDPRERKSP